MYSFFDEENEMRKYMKNKKKSAQDFSYVSYLFSYLYLFSFYVSV